MLESHWLALGAFSMIMTLAWLFIERRLMVTTLFAGAGWAYMAISADALTRITDTGTEIAASAGSIGYVCTGLAILSLVAALLAKFDHYPPEEDDPADAAGVTQS